MNQLGRPRDPNIPRSDRICSVHGLTEHAGNVANYGGSIAWRCMLCSRETSQKHRNEIAAGTRVPQKRDKKNQQREVQICPTCFQELPVTGVCDNCD